MSDPFIISLPREIRELILLKSHLMLNEQERKIQSKSQQNVYTALSSVCASWWNIATLRPWFAKALRRKLLKRHAVLELPRLPRDVWEQILLKSFLGVHDSVLRTVKPRRPDTVVYEMLTPICRAWRQTVTGRAWFAKTLRQQLSQKKLGLSLFSNLPSAVWERTLTKSFVMLYESLAHRAAGQEGAVYELLASVSSIWRQTANTPAGLQQQSFQKSFRRLLLMRDNVLARKMADMPMNEHVLGVAQMCDRMYLLVKQLSTSATDVSDADDKLYKISVYDLQSFEQLRNISLTIILNPVDVVGCSLYSCLYVLDADGGRIWHLTDEGRTIMNWIKPADTISSIKSISVADDGHLVCLTLDSMLYLYTPDPAILVTFSLSELLHPKQAIKTNMNTFMIVASGYVAENVCGETLRAADSDGIWIFEVLPDGHVIRSFRTSDTDRHPFIGFSPIIVSIGSLMCLSYASTVLLLNDSWQLCSKFIELGSSQVTVKEFGCKNARVVRDGNSCESVKPTLDKLSDELVGRSITRLCYSRESRRLIIVSRMFEQIGDDGTYCSDMVRSEGVTVSMLNLMVSMYRVSHNAGSKGVINWCCLDC